MEVTNTPLCEVCRTRPATAFVGFRSSTESTVSRWQFTCSAEMAPDETESFSISDMFSSTEAVIDRLAHLHQSGRIDWQPFMDMMVRYRDAMKQRP